MLLLIILAAAIGIGLIRGGRISNMTHIKIRHPWLIFFSILVEYGLLFLMRRTALVTQPMVFLSVFLQYLLLFVFLWLNQQLAYSWLVGLGSFLNFLVIMSNKGSMPLSGAAVIMDANSKNLQYLADGRYLTYHIINDNSKFWFLGDVIFVPSPIKAFLSIGDLILFIGILLLVQDIIAGKTRKEQE